MASYNWTDGELVTAEKLNAYSKGMEQIKTDTEAAQAAAETARDTAAQKASDAEQSAQSAENARAAAEEKANTASTAASNAEASAIDAASAKTAAETAKTAAETAKAEAETAATDASGSKTAAEQSAAASAQSAESAAQSASSASENATAAQQSKEAAALSEANALSSENAAAKSATAAAEDKNLASTSASAAATSETNAASSASAAQTAQAAAEAARDQAQEIVGGDFATKTDLNNHTSNTNIHITSNDRNAWNNKVDKVSGKGLSTNDYTNAEKTKLSTLNAAIIVQNNVSVLSSAWASDVTYVDYPFKASIPIDGCTVNHIPEITFALADATSGNFAPIAETYDGGVYIYAAEVPSEAITIPTIKLTKVVN